MGGRDSDVSGQASIFGYTIQSPLSFMLTRNGEGDGPLRITLDGAIEPPAGPALLEWQPRPDHPRGARLHQSGSGYSVWIDQSGWFQIDHRQPAIAIPPSADPWRREASLWGLPAALCFIERGDLSLHAAAVEVDGSAILLAAPGRGGKTTLACGFLQSGYRVLAEDVSCCRPSAVPLLLPGPAMLRVRADTFAHVELAGTRVVAEDPDRVILSIGPHASGEGRAVPVRAVVVLGASTSEPALERVALPEAIRALWSLSFRLPGDVHRARCFQAVTAIASAVPVWSFRWRRSFRGLTDAVTAIASVVGD